MFNNDNTQSPEEKFHKYVEPMFKKLLVGAYRLTKSHEDAEDLVQDTLFKAYKNMDKFDENLNPGGWLYTIMRNTFLNNIKQNKSREFLLFDGNDSEKLADKSQAPAQDRGIEDSLQLVLNSLPTPMQTILVARETQQLSYEEIAKSFDIPLGTVKSRLKRARNMLREKWKRQNKNVEI